VAEKRRVSHRLRAAGLTEEPIEVNEPCERLRKMNAEDLRWCGQGPVAE